MMKGEVWLCRGLWEHERPHPVRIEEILVSGMVDVNYQLDQSQPGDLRILPKECLIVRVQYMDDLPSVPSAAQANVRRSDH